MKKEFGVFGKKGVASFQIMLMVMSLFAFSYMIYSSEVVRANDDGDSKVKISGTNPDDLKNDMKAGKPVADAGKPVVDISKSVAPPNINTPTSYNSWSGVPIFAEGTKLDVGTYTSGSFKIDGKIITLKSGETGTISAIEGEKLGLIIKDSKGNIIKNTKSFTITSGPEGVRGVAGKSGSTLSKWLGAGGGTGADALLSGLQWAAIAYMAGKMIGSLLGMSDKNTKALSTAMSLGAGSYKALSVWTKTAGKWMANPLVGVGISVVVFAMMYRKESVKSVEFNCMPWQAPTGGDVCEKCNDANLPCSEYRCRALGQNCELLNKGTDQENCVTVRNDDTNPPIISPDENKLTSGHKYTNVKNSPPGPGFNIVNIDSSDGCLKAFTPLEFGVNSDEPAQCKIDFNHTLNFDDMVSFMGGNNLYLYNHSERFSLPGANDIENSSFPLENGKDLTFFIRCRDKQGNENSAEYAVRFCIDPTPDSTAPQVKATSISNEGCVAEEQANAAVEFYINEPANCRWSSQDQDYDNMQNGMVCSNQLYQMNAEQLFTCKANLTGIARDETKFYVRCKDQPGKAEEDRNENKESYVFSLRGSTGLKMKNLQPNGTIFGAVRPSPVELYTETLFGCNNGQAVCFYSIVDNDGDYIMFYDTNTEDGIHTQRLDLDSGNHKYYIKCVDEGGNVAKDIMEFSLDIDESAPVVARVYEEDEMLKVVTVRDSECCYSLDNCDFSFDEGTQMPYANSTVHVAEWVEGRTYYIKCRDEFRNEDSDCSVVVRLSQNFL